MPFSSPHPGFNKQTNHLCPCDSCDSYCQSSTFPWQNHACLLNMQRLMILVLMAWILITFRPDEGSGMMEREGTIDAENKLLVLRRWIMVDNLSNHYILYTTDKVTRISLIHQEDYHSFFPVKLFDREHLT